MLKLHVFKKSFAFWVLIFVVSTSCANENSTPLAFDGALGFGKFTQGGHGGEIYRVTSLNDSKQPGTLRYGIRLKQSRIIEFDVSGVIKLTSPLKINNGNISILGQTSPHGVAIVGAPFTVSADNVIIQHIRFRLGTYGYAEDALTVRNTTNVIIDHCSISWSVDEAASMYGNSNFTLQNSIISNSLNKSIHPKGNHGYGGIWGGRNATFVNNIIANHVSRTPRINGYRLNSPYTAEEEYIEVVNNLIFNWGHNSAYGSENGRFSLVNNYYLPGPDSKAERIFDLSYSEQPFKPTAYIQGNIYHGKPWDKNNLQGVIVRTKNKQKHTATSTSDLFTNNPILPHAKSVLNAQIPAAKQVFRDMLKDKSVGAYATKNGKFFDSIDSQLYEQISLTMNSDDVTKMPSAIINHENQQISSLEAYHKQFIQ
ncbi:hypothetical protein L0668_15890 [Paraglaciecola aquimarina]|uniref:Pectate lyase domain-containing protein n=1 Tax=Paraglaciecola algarum TaxID=3050085 RepID=A0ABS9D9K7_9ALTE|nr:hypothetical protein [Paraglaciecola sp. G1-23]MCF2949603.1 hypothetical protein [Paraglaciecola sp. G1-23]